MKSSHLRTLLLTFAILVIVSVAFYFTEDDSLMNIKLNAWRSSKSLKETHLDGKGGNLSEVRVLCWVMTSPATRLERTVPIENTWGKRCNKLLLMSSRTDNQTDRVIALPVDEGRENLWRKVRAAYKYIYEHHLDDADWFMKTDDDT